MQKQTLYENWTVRPISNLAEVPAAVRDAIIPARVPGCVHTDLMRAGLIEDPYYGQSEPKLLWIGRTNWQYRASFDADPGLFDHERIDLVFDGLDTVARIELNGSHVADTANMHRGYRFDARPMLRKGRNELVITFTSPVNYAEQMRAKLGHMPALTYGGWFNFIRKMACNFGWDWGPVVPTCGIWRGVRLEAWNCARIECIHPLVTALADGRVQLRVEVKLETASGKPAWNWSSGSELSTPIGALLPSKSFTAGGSPYIPEASLFEIENPEVWWPHGHGGQTRYMFKHVLMGERGTFADDSRSIRIALRTVELDSSPDDIGRKFVLKVNGKPIFCKGFNWIPDDCFLDRACTPERYRKRIQQAIDANANMLRVWGGGIYETDEFYDICDELGMLVWQDFPFACATYPEVEPIRSEVEAEARYNVARLSHHPSLVLWNGCNENLWGYPVWGSANAEGKHQIWREQVKGKGWGAGYYLDLLPKIVKELDPSRPYWAASPWSGDPDVENGLHPNLSTHGNKHIWEVWHGQGDYTNYRQFSPRFCSEFGYQGPPNYATMAKYFGNSAPSPRTRGEGGGEGSSTNEVGPAERGKTPTLTLPPSTGGGDQAGALERTIEAGVQKEHPAGRSTMELRRGSATMEMHQKSPGGNERNDRLLARDFDIEGLDFDDWHYLLQLNQARALRTGVEWFRSRQPVCMGTLYWQLNDCYPAMSWSAIDCDGRPKLLWYATRRFYAPRLLTIQPEADALVVYANNDTDEPWRQTGLVRRLDFAGRELGRIEVLIEAAARANQQVAVLPVSIASPDDKSRELIVADAGGARGIWFFALDRELVYPEPRPRGSLERVGTDAWRLNLTTSALLREATIQIDRIDPHGSISDNGVTILPGETFSFLIHSAKDLSLEQLLLPPVFQCANRFGRR